MPYAGYDDFQDCVEQNQDKDDPEAFCAWLHHEETGEWPGEASKQKNEKGGDGTKMPAKSDDMFNLNTFMSDLREYVWDNKIKGMELGEYGGELIHVFLPTPIKKGRIIVGDWDRKNLKEVEFEVGEDDKITFGDPVEVEEVYVQKALLASNPRVSVKTLQQVMDTTSLEQCREFVQKNAEVDDPQALYTWIHHRITGKWPDVDMAAEKNKKLDGPELTGPIVFKDSKKRIAYGAVLVPGEPDHDQKYGEKILTAEEIERVAHEFMENYGNIDLLHSLNNVAKPVENYLLPMEMNVEISDKEMTLPKGTWILASKIGDDDAWDKVEKGELAGYSVMGIKKSALKKMKQAVKSGNTAAIQASLKKTLIKDLGDDWIVAAVSIVDEPCVPKAKFFALKSKEIDAAQKGILEKIKSFFAAKSNGGGGILNVANKEGRVISTENKTKLTQIQELQEMIGKLIEDLLGAGIKEEEGKTEYTEGGTAMTQEELNAIAASVKSQIEEGTKPLLERLDAVEKELGKKKETDDDEGGATKDKDTDNKDKSVTKDQDKDQDKGQDKDQDNDQDQDQDELAILKQKVEDLEKENKDLQDFRDQAAKSFTTSKQSKGQDDDNKDDNKDTAEKRYNERDDFGRLRRLK